MVSLPFSFSTAAARGLRAGRVRGVLGAACIATVLGMAASAVQAASHIGLLGEVWFNTDPYANLPAEARVKDAILSATEDAMRARPADGRFIATAFDYPQGANTVISSGTGAGTVADFLGTDAASLVLRDGAIVPREPLRLSLWRFTGTLLLAPNTTYDFRISSDDGNATWMGHPAGVYPEYPDHETRTFRVSGTFQMDCCLFSHTTGDDGAVPFKMIFYERYGNTGLRMDWRAAGTEDYGVLQGPMLSRGDTLAPSPIPLPAAGWMLLVALGGLGAVGWRRRA